MPVARLTITDFRNLNYAELEPAKNGFNVIYGQNGSGKTSLLEAIYYLGHGKSFRTSTLSKLIHHESKKFSLFCQIVKQEQSIPLGAEWDTSGGARIRVSGSDVANLAELAGYLPVRIINSQSHQLFEAGPVFRRKFLDWGLFYQAPTFLTVWRQFERVLKQRNLALKNQLPRAEVDNWTDELVQYTNEFDRLRREYLFQFEPCFRAVLQSLLPFSSLSITYEPGWNGDVDYSAALAASYQDERRYGCTQCGPHRADFNIQIDGVSVRHFLSRGQQKLLICAMIIAQGKLLSDVIHPGPVYLVDDLPSELDFTNGGKLVSLLADQQSQVFITAIDQTSMKTYLDGITSTIPMKVFHVEHGQVRES